MTSTLVESGAWTRRRWWGLVVLIFGVQLVLIFWLGETSPIRPRPAAPTLTLKLAGSASAELLALHDPTLFALPHPQGVLAPTWLRTPRPEFQSFAWPELTNYPLVAIDQLGAAFNRFVETNTFNPLPLPAKPLPELTLPELTPLAISAPHSTLRLEWGQIRRQLLTPLELRSWQNQDILTNSVVQIVVDAEGRPASVTLLSGSGSKAADQQALEQANAARFEPLSRNLGAPAFNPAAQLTWGRMVFEWHTLPLPLTNAPAAGP
jgi:TonB family protein